jgi:hypothetical protein
MITTAAGLIVAIPYYLCYNYSSAASNISPMSLTTIVRNSGASDKREGPVKIAPTRKYMFNLESVAMTDIVLNMFIFFFISFSLLYTFNPTKAKVIKVNCLRPGTS